MEIGTGLRAAAARFPAGVVVISSVLHKHDHAMTATAFLSVSIEPPLVLISIGADSRMADAIEMSGGYAVSILSRSQQRIADWLATPGRPVVNQLSQVPHHRGGNGAILVDDAVAHFECDTHAIYAAGDHVLILGLVQAVSVSDTMTDPLLYHEQAYRKLA